MVKRTLMALGLGVSLLGLGGLSTAAHASGHVRARPAVVHVKADLPGDADASAPCATDATGNETGDCLDSQNASGPQDSATTPETGTEAATAASPDGDNVQSGDQSGSDTGGVGGQ